MNRQSEEEALNRVFSTAYDTMTICIGRDKAACFETFKVIHAGGFNRGFSYALRLLYSKLHDVQGEAVRLISYEDIMKSMYGNEEEKDSNVHTLHKVDT